MCRSCCGEAFVLPEGETLQSCVGRIPMPLIATVPARDPSWYRWMIRLTEYGVARYVVSSVTIHSALARLRLMEP